VATKTIKVSDLSGEEIGGEEHLARVVIEEHPQLQVSVTLEVLDQEVQSAIPEEQNFVRGTYYPSSESGGVPRTFVMSIEDFTNLSPNADMETVLTDAQREQQEREGKRRGRRGRRTGERRQRIDYASPEHAGEPHRGRITDAEKAYVRANLADVNRRLRQQDLREIDPNDPDMAERYGLTATTTDTIEEEQFR
jgi:hypothetical protein